MVAQVAEADAVKCLAEAEIKEDAIWVEIKNWLESLPIEDLDAFINWLEEFIAKPKEEV